MIKNAIKFSMLYLCYSLTLYPSATSFNPSEIIDNLTTQQPYLDRSLYDRMQAEDKAKYLFKWHKIQVELLAKVLDQLSTSVNSENVNQTLRNLLDQNSTSILMDQLGIEKNPEFPSDKHQRQIDEIWEEKPLVFILAIAEGMEYFWNEYSYCFKDKFPTDPEFEATYSNSNKKIKDLIANMLTIGCDPNLFNIENPLFQALQLEYDHGEIAEKLLKCNANPTINGQYSRLPYWTYAAGTLNHERTNLFQELLNSTRPLHQELLNKALREAIDPEIARLLIKEGAQPEQAFEFQKQHSAWFRHFSEKEIPMLYCVGLSKLQQTDPAFFHKPDKDALC